MGVRTEAGRAVEVAERPDEDGTCINVGCVPTKVLLHRAVFMTPPLARVGLTERQARDGGHAVKVASRPVAQVDAMPRARIVGSTRGLMKFAVGAETDEVLGAALLNVGCR